MEYCDIIRKINSFRVLNFTMDDFSSLSDIVKEIESIYQKEVLEEKLDAKVRHDAAMDHLYTIVFSILKQKLHFEDEVINKIMNLIDYAKIIADVFVLDGNVIVKVKDNKDNNVFFIPLDNFFDITSDEFSKNVSNNDFTYFIMQSLNNSIGSWFNDKIGKKKLLSMNNNIAYNLPDTNIFVNNGLKSIIDSIFNHIPQITKLILRFEDELYSFDMKMHDEYLMLSYNDYPVNKLSEILVKREKTKKL